MGIIYAVKEVDVKKIGVLWYSILILALDQGTKVLARVFLKDNGVNVPAI